MKRAENKGEKQLKWQRTGRGTGWLTIGGKRKIVKPNEKFKATEKEVPKVFRDQYECLTKVVEKKPLDGLGDTTLNPFEVCENEGVVSIHNKKTKKDVELEKEITKEEADEMVKELNEKHNAEAKK